MNHHYENDGKMAGGLLGFLAGLNPMTSFTFVIALIVSGFAAWIWLRNGAEPHSPFPAYGAVAASYAGGFLIGRVFRRVLKTAALLGVVLLGLLGLLNHLHVDTSKAQQAVKAGSGWLQDRAGWASDYLMHFLPSGGAAGFGVFAGGRRRQESDGMSENLEARR